jgi:hypothetical protein
MKSLTFGAWALVLLAAGCGSSRQTEGSAATAPTKAIWQSQPIYIDGSDNDWVRPLPYSVKEEFVGYSISNDEKNLYVLLTTASRQEQQKMIEGGMSVWVNTKGDQSNGDAVGIGYPLNEQNDRDRQLMQEAQPQRYQNKTVKLEDKHTYALYGFNKDTTIRSYNYGDSNPVGVNMRMDYNNRGELVYEAAIPLQSLYPGHTPGTPYPMENLAVGIFIEPLPSGSRVPRGGGGSGPGFGIGLGTGFGGFGSGVGMGMGVSHEFGAGGKRAGKTLFDEAQIWRVVKLAQRKN